MTARFAATTKHASPSDSSVTMIMTVEMDLMSQWNVASRFIFVFLLLLMLTTNCTSFESCTRQVGITNFNSNGGQISGLMHKGLMMDKSCEGINTK